jgi:molybdopterin/thiamine biosynthesis adenylyltransferase
MSAGHIKSSEYPEARDRLAQSRILIVGVGGLGAPAALHLAAAGVGTLGLIDGDTVELSNLHRQIIYRTADIGRPKVAAAAARLALLHPTVTTRCLAQRLTAENATNILRDFDFVIDATDGIASKYLVNDAAVLCRVPFSHAGVLAFQGQTMTVFPGRSACLRCLFPTPPAADEMPTCQEAGIIGSVAGSIGILQATEALKHLLGIGACLANRLLTYDALTTRWRTVVLAPRPDCPLCGEHPSIHAPAGGEDRTCQ